MSEPAQRDGGRRQGGRLAPIALVALVLLVPSVFYLGYVLDQLRQVSDRNLRLLEGASGRLEKVLTNTATTVGNLARQIQRMEEPAEAGTDPKTDLLLDFDHRQPFLDLVSPIPPSDAESTPVCAEKTVKVQEVGGKIQVVAAECAPELVFNVRLQETLEGLALEQAFEQILLADDQGRVILQVEGRRTLGEARSGLRVDRLDKLPQPESDELLSLQRLRGASSIKTVVLAEESYDLLCQPVRVPLDPEPQSADPPEDVPAAELGRWTLCGLVPAGRSLEESLAVAPQLTLSLGLLFLLGLVTWPLVKLFLMKRRERLRFADAYLLFQATLSLLVFCSILIADGDAYLDLHEAHEAGLENLSADVSEDFSKELRELHDQLDAYDRTLCENLPRAGIDLESDPGLAFDETRLLDGGGHGVLGGEAPRYRDFSSVFWMNGDGLQVGKGSVRERNTSQVNVGHREYFRAVQEDRLWTFREGVSLPGKPARKSFVFDSFRSITTGDHSTVLSFRSCLSDLAAVEEEPGTKSYVAAISSEPSSVIRPVLPLGFGFALFDGEGRILFHSDGRRALEGSLFDEVEELSRLQSAMFSKSAQTFRSRYLARPHVLHVRPLREAPWWIVTYYDLEIVRTVNLEAVAHAILLALAYLLLFNLPPLLYVALVGRRFTWLWPDVAKQSLYARLAWKHGLLLLFGLYVLCWSPFRVGARFWLLFPAVALLLTAIQYFVWQRSKKRSPSGPILSEPKEPSGDSKTFSERWHSQRRRFHRAVTRRPLLAHLAAAVLLWQVIAVLPGLGFFRLSYEEARTAMFKLESLDLLRRLEARERRIDQHLRSVPTADPEAERKRLLDRERGIYLVSSFDSYLGAAGALDPEIPGLRSDVLIERMARYKPLYNTVSTRLRYLLAERASNDDWLWQESQGSGGVFQPRPDGPVGSRWLQADRLRWEPGLGPFAVFGGGALLLLLVLWVRYSAQHLFFGKIGRQVQPLEVGELLECQWKKSVVAQMASPLDRRRLSTSAEHAVVDLEGPKNLLAREQLAAQKDKGEASVVCENFEAGLEDPETRRWKLLQLEELVLHRGRVVILPTALNPFEELLGFGTHRPEDAGDGELGSVISLQPEEARRWGRLLSEFGIVPVGLTASREEGKPSDSAARRRSDWEARELMAAVALEPLAAARVLPAHRIGRQEALERLVEAAEGYYWALWTACSEDEKLTLVQLAQERFVNPKQASTVRRLLQRGLVVRDPRLRLMNDSFALFVQRIHRPVEVARLERLTQGLGWLQLRWALLGLLAVLALFLFVTQQALFDATIGFLSALAIGVPGLLKVISTLHRSGGRSMGP